MRLKFKIIPNLKNKNSFIIHPDSAESLGITNRRKVLLRFGVRSWEVKLITSHDLSKNEISLSHELIGYQNIPISPRFEIIWRDNELILGPFIGILAARTKEKLAQIVDTLSNYLYNYEHISGAVLAFSSDAINDENHTIDGYIFNPESQLWEKGIYTYPSAVFKRVGISKALRNHFHSLLGNRVFNDYVFNKWEMHLWLSSLPQVKDYLPESMLYTKPDDLRWFLELHERAYVKPILGSQGVGLIQTVKKGKRLFLTYSDPKQKKKLCFFTNREANAFFKSKLKSKKFIMQKAIDLISYDDRLIDFRLLILKNQHGEWEDIGMVARYGKQNSIVSNVSSGGIAERGEITLKKVLQLNDDKLYELRKKMSTIAVNAAKCLETCGLHCGNLGIDMAIDTEGRIWIIEINNKDPNHTIAIDAGDRQMFYRAKLANMLYAKRLAGFTIQK